MSSVKGVAPGFLLLPAREYSWELVNRITLTVPNRGNINEILNRDKMSLGINFPGDPEFTIFEDNLLQLWEIIRVLFAQMSYPALKEDECLNIVALEMKGEDLVLHGEIIRSV